MNRPFYQGWAPGSTDAVRVYEGDLVTVHTHVGPMRGLVVAVEISRITVENQADGQRAQIGGTYRVEKHSLLDALAEAAHNPHDPVA